MEFVEQITVEEKNKIIRPPDWNNKRLIDYKAGDTIAVMWACSYPLKKGTLVKRTSTLYATRKEAEDALTADAPKNLPENYAGVVYQVNVVLNTEFFHYEFTGEKR